MNVSQTEISKDLFEVHIDFSDLEVDKKEVALTLGYVNGTIPSYFGDMIDSIFIEAEKLCMIRAGYKLFDFKYNTAQKGGVFVDGTFFKTDKIVSGQLKKSEKAVLFMNTIGSSLENRTKELIVNGDSTYGFIVDTTASIIAESVTNRLHDHIENEMQKHGWNITNRYSPGYCNWSVAEQQKLFSKFPKDFCGITLTDTSMMIPKKSVSGIIGVGPLVKRRNYICDKCDVKDCTYRSKRLVTVK